MMISAAGRYGGMDVALHCVHPAVIAVSAIGDMQIGGSIPDPFIPSGSLHCLLQALRVRHCQSNGHKSGSKRCMMVTAVRG